MKTHRSLLVLFALSILGACGGGGGAGNDAGGGGSDTGGAGAGALVGSWFMQVTPVSADNQTETVTFAADGTASFVHTQVDATTSDHPGCTETCTTPGAYTATATSVTTTANTASATNAYSGCTDPTQNGPTAATSCQSLASTYNWAVAGTTLTLTDPSNPSNTIVLMRR